MFDIDGLSAREHGYEFRRQERYSVYPAGAGNFNVSAAGVAARFERHYDLK